MRFLWKCGIIKSGNVGAYLLIRLSVICLVLVIADLLPQESMYKVTLGFIPFLLSLVIIIDILLANTSVAFVSRRPANALRSAIFTLLSFATLTLAFSVFFLLAEAGFSDTPMDSATTSESPSSLNSLRAVYFSFVTITTLGYGEILPVSNTFIGYVAQFLIVLELISGLYFILIVLTTVTSWGNDPPTVSYPVPLTQLLEQYRHCDTSADNGSPSENP